ncbi:cation transporting atpase [Anaeramoeba flamelloides]|uniref:Calcium-transporting ATPase n=1 Tax=Anaeramoeba flamelloides TaxID=1746091 RepID=A0ABQ8XEE8_9EUKA|nr:cation transporting atpase [Anaeramoeba flamelloides]
MTDFEFELTNEQLLELSAINDPNTHKNLEKLGGVKKIMKKLHVDPGMGLTLAEQKDNFSNRRSVYGENRFDEPPHTPFWKLFVETFKDTTLIILIIAAVVSLALGIFVEDNSGGWIEGTAILIAVLIVSLVTAINDYQKEKQFRALNGVKENIDVTLFRQTSKDAEIGEEVQVSVYEINCGDILVLKGGDKIPADALLFTEIQGGDLRINEASVTGESKDIKKSLEEDPFVKSGTLVVSGEGRAVVTGVGMNSQYGRMKLNFNEPDPPTPLQDKLDKMAILIGKIGLYCAILTVGVLFIMIVIDWVRHGWDKEFISEAVEAFIIGVTIVVVAVPEGLPLAVTISLAYSMKKMMKDNNLVRRLASCETMGNATNICSDKTGTLTQNIMSVTQAYLFGTHYEKIPKKKTFIRENLKILNESIAVNSRAFLEEDEKGRITEVGSRTECGLIRMIQKFNFDYKKCRVENNPRTLHAYLFNSEKKRMTTILNGVDEEDQNKIVYSKGASEIMLELCNRSLTETGEIIELDKSSKKEVTKILNEMASNGLRTLALTYKEFEEYDEKMLEEQENFETDLILIGIVGIKDPVRDGVPDAVLQCQKAGITVRMVTGDNILTAKHIARECNILTEEGTALEGYKFRKMSREEKLEVVPTLQVLARSSPQDKYDLVKLLMDLEEVVAVTGDGQNDAPALKKANVGLSMGITGTDLAKEASDIVILDDNFTSIVTAVMWGRSVYDNIRKFLQFQLTVNLVALSTAFLAAVSGKGTPLKAVQLLWVNLIMDTMAALALGTEPPTRKLLDREPYHKRESLLSNIMIRNLVGQGVYQLIVLLVILYAGSKIWGYDIDIEDEKIHLYTILFNAFVMCQVFNEINCRKIDDDNRIFKGMFNNKIFVAIVVITAAVQAVVVEVGGSFFSTTGLTWQEWITCVAIGLFSIPVGFLLRLIPVPVDKIPDLKESDKKKKKRRKTKTKKDFDELEGSSGEQSSSNDDSEKKSGKIDLSNEENEVVSSSDKEESSEKESSDKDNTTTSSD